ncbi:TIGR02611 family protein [Nocardia sp. NBC_00565]|uniref:TIGR02611 family protein n=1 Tax=Nocardia sp. NBC_00565 TaxID=2975993 RepID=UPI002E81696E|nr:TIGR02611 family protein [Nocardia sp. NBC_00565]
MSPETQLRLLGTPSRWRALRAWVAERPTLDIAYRIGVAVLGTAVLLVGILAIPYPGPGWAIVFAGLGILATEFAPARRTLRWLQGKYRQGMAWYSARGPAMRVPRWWLLLRLSSRHCGYWEHSGCSAAGSEWNGSGCTVP